MTEEEELHQLAHELLALRREAQLHRWTDEYDLVGYVSKKMEPIEERMFVLLRRRRRKGIFGMFRQVSREQLMADFVGYLETAKQAERR